MSNFSFSHNVSYSDNCTPFVHIFDIRVLFAAELEGPKIGIWGKGLMQKSTLFTARMLMDP